MEFYESSAILVVDMQNGFCDESAEDRNHNISKKRIDRIKNEVIPAIRRLLHQARKFRLPIVYLCSNRNIIGPATDIVSELSPESEDRVFWRYAPTESPLKEEYGFESWLCFQSIRHFYIVGIYREYCVERIAGELRQAGYGVTIIDACTG